eukprot:Skav211075  [mRNA]  locus=scaffold314:305601:305891:- [translate_table: standard]
MEHSTEHSTEHSVEHSLSILCSSCHSLFVFAGVEELERRQSREKKQDAFLPAEMQFAPETSYGKLTRYCLKEEERRAPVFMCRHVGISGDVFFWSW